MADATGQPIAVLLSGGIDSAVLVAELCNQHSRVHPLYVRCGLHWEEAELVHARRFLSDVNTPALAPLKVFDLPLADLYAGHWSVTGHEVPDETTPDEAVFLPGRNFLLLAKPALWCLMNGIGQLALGVLKANPFPDSTAEFYDAFGHAVACAMGAQNSVRNIASPGDSPAEAARNHRGPAPRRLQILRLFADLSKTDVLRRGRALPLQLTFSCIQPAGGLHCGRCNKCAERRSAFGAAGIEDLTRYCH